MQIKTARKIGFWAALAMLVGSVVGIGIFFKNGSVIGANEKNAAGALTTWIIGGLLSLFAAICFSEIGSLKTTGIHGLPGWAKSAFGNKFGLFVTGTYPVFYFGILIPVMGFFVSELFFFFINNCNSSIDVPDVWVHIVVGIALAAFAVIINFLSVRISGIIAVVTVALKAIPLVLALVIGIVLANTHNANGQNYFTNGSKFEFRGLLAALPAVLFAYDAFLNVGALTPKTKGGTQTVSRIILIGMGSVIILYTLIAVAALLHGGSIALIIQDALPAGASQGVAIFVYGILFFSGYGVLNGMSAAGVATFEQVVQQDALAGTKWLKDKFGENRTKIFLLFIVLSFWSLVVFLPTGLLNTDGFVDMVSNFPTLFFFAIYALVILGYSKKRSKLETEKLNTKWFLVATWITIIGVGFVEAYQLGYGFTIKLLIDPSVAYQGLGLFAYSEHSLTNVEFFGAFLAFFAAFIGIGVANNILNNRKLPPILD